VQQKVGSLAAHSQRQSRETSPAGNNHYRSVTSVCLVRQIAARQAIVFEALVSAEGIRSWWGPDDGPATSAEVDGRVGGGFRVRFRTADGLEHECAGEFLEIEKPERVVMSWRWTQNGQIEEHGKASRLEIRLRATQTGTELTLVHSLLSNENSARAHEGGWDGALRKLHRRFHTILEVS
jgi:uncharacterized protein YndB with AHSA1/START domain